ncbi:hypothetical protein EVAR_19324_1 [Eumeta japonica]|uniref:Uncharacterized protein n=1 Tax=Eumeta variegata TaxID=151549 RepID=A0A4C1TRI9_EUMVA|nr:hypothetical protein EVAR_19324_1 [Eumeta japonica]
MVVGVPPGPQHAPVGPSLTRQMRATCRARPAVRRGAAQYVYKNIYRLRCDICETTVKGFSYENIPFLEK